MLQKGLKIICRPQAVVVTKNVAYAEGESFPVLRLLPLKTSFCQVTKAERTDRGWRLHGKMGSDGSDVTQETGLLVLTDPLAALPGVIRRLLPQSLGS